MQATGQIPNNVVIYILPCEVQSPSPTYIHPDGCWVIMPRNPAYPNSATAISYSGTGPMNNYNGICVQHMMPQLVTDSHEMTGLINRYGHNNDWQNSSTALAATELESIMNELQQRYSPIKKAVQDVSNSASPKALQMDPQVFI